MKKKSVIFAISFLFTIIGTAQTYNMQNTSISTCSGKFYDSGGTGNYSSNENYTMTFCSSTPGNPLVLTFTTLNINTNDLLQIYEGSNTSTCTIGKFPLTCTVGGACNQPGCTGQSLTNGVCSCIACGTVPGPPFTFVSMSGCITISFKSSATAPKAGWVADISCTKPVGNNICNTSLPFCTDTSYNFPATINKTAQVGPDYGCLTDQPNPSWYYMKIKTAGSMMIDIGSSPGVADIDFACWGPFTDPRKACACSLTASCPSGGCQSCNPHPGTAACKGYPAGNLVDCSYDPSNTEKCFIPNAKVGEYYVLMLTNFENATTNITFKQTGGVAKTDCDIIIISDNGPLCAGQTLLLVVNNPVAGDTYSWTGPNGFTSTQMNPVLTPTTLASAGVYTLTIKTSLGAIRNVASTTLVINSCGPTVTAANGKVCSGSCTNITATATGGTLPYSFSWSPGSLTGSSVSVCPTSTTTYTVVSTDKLGGTASSISVVTVNPKPTITLSSSSVCPGVCTTITAGGGVSYSWSSPFSGTASTQSACPTAITTYSVTGTDSNGCTNTATATVSMNPLPTVTVSNLTTCKDTVGTITASGAITYTWSCGGTGTTIKPSTSVIGISTCTVTGTDTKGCKNSAVSTITVNDCSKPSVNIIDGTICIGNCYNITAVGIGGVGALTYTWTPNIGVGAGPFNICPTTTTSYTVTISDANGATASDVATVTVIPLPTITATNATVCNGVCATLTASGAGTGTYTWSSSLGNGSTQNVCPTTTTSYSLTGTDASGCTNTATTTVIIVPLPVITVPDANICPGGATTLTASGANTYTWSPAIGLSASTGTSVTANPASATTYTVCGTSIDGCSSCTTVKVTVGALIANAGSDVAICDGTCTTLTASGGTIFTWSPTTGLSNPNISSPSACPIVTTTYTVNVSDGTCSDDAIVVVTVNQNPAPTITGVLAICSGQNTTLTANAGGTYLWNSGQTTPSIVVNPNTTNSYSVIVTTNNCTGSATVQVTVTPTPAPVISGITTICTGGTTTLTSNTAGPYSWSPGGETTASITLTPTASSTSYVVSVTQNGCTGTAGQIVTVIPPVVASITGSKICIGDNVVLTAGSGLNYTYIWNTGATSISITDAPVVMTTYSLTVNVGTCTNTATYSVIVNPLPIPIASGDTTILYGQSTPLKSTGGGTYSWIPPTGLNCSNCPNPIATPRASTQYCVIIKTLEGCSDSACVSVKVDLKCGFEGELFVPNGFSPNGDGQNDVLYVRGLGITAMYWAIFDRWGEKVYESTDFTKGWDGTYKGKQLDPAVYVYYLKVTCITGDEINQKGNVAIIK